MSIQELHLLYKCLSGTPERVLQLLQEPVFLNPTQERIYGYLRNLIGNFSIHNTRIFLRFVTGNSVMSLSPIIVIFNGVSGLAHCPIAHTCDNTLEISTSYSTYMEFANEFMTVLSSTECWSMDIFRLQSRANVSLSIQFTDLTLFCFCVFVSFLLCFSFVYYRTLYSFSPLLISVLNIVKDGG